MPIEKPELRINGKGIRDDIGSPTTYVIHANPICKDFLRVTGIKMNIKEIIGDSGRQFEDYPMDVNIDLDIKLKSADMFLKRLGLYYWYYPRRWSGKMLARNHKRNLRKRRKI